MRRGGHRSRHRLRKQIVEPVTGHIKEARGFRRFSMRGAGKARGEWSLLCTVHNLPKLAARRGGAAWPSASLFPVVRSTIRRRRRGGGSGAKRTRGPAGPAGPVTTEPVAGNAAGDRLLPAVRLRGRRPPATRGELCPYVPEARHARGARRPASFDARRGAEVVAAPAGVRLRRCTRRAPSRRPLASCRRTPSASHSPGTPGSRSAQPLPLSIEGDRQAPGDVELTIGAGGPHVHDRAPRGIGLLRVGQALLARRARRRVHAEPRRAGRGVVVVAVEAVSVLRELRPACRPTSASRWGPLRVRSPARRPARSRSGRSRRRLGSRRSRTCSRPRAEPWHRCPRRHRRRSPRRSSCTRGARTVERRERNQPPRSHHDVPYLALTARLKKAFLEAYCNPQKRARQRPASS